MHANDSYIFNVANGSSCVESDRFMMANSIQLYIETMMLKPGSASRRDDGSNETISRPARIPMQHSEALRATRELLRKIEPTLSG